MFYTTYDIYNFKLIRYTYSNGVVVGFTWMTEEKWYGGRNKC